MSFNKFSRREFSSHAQQIPSKLCLLPPSLQWMFWSRLCAILSMPMIPPACLNPPSAEIVTSRLGYELKHHFLHPIFLWGHPSSQGKQQGDHVYLLHEHVSAPVLCGGEISSSGCCQEEAFLSHTRRMCVVVTRVLIHELSPLDTSKSFIIELHCWNIVLKFQLM